VLEPSNKCNITIIGVKSLEICQYQLLLIRKYYLFDGIRIRFRFLIHYPVVIGICECNIFYNIFIDIEY